MMTKEDWKKGLDAWNNVLKQAKIDQEQAELYIKVIEDKIRKLEKCTYTG
jgi:hypothetical protein